MTTNKTDRAAIDKCHLLFNQELAARVMGDLTGTPVESWRERVKGWFRKTFVTTGETVK